MALTLRDITNRVAADGRLTDMVGENGPVVTKSINFFDTRK